MSMYFSSSTNASNLIYQSKLLSPLKDHVRVTSTADIDLVTGGLLTIDGVLLSAGDRVLVRDQIIGSENGIYVVDASSWYRSEDASESEMVPPGTLVFSSEGLLNGNKFFFLSTDAPIVLNTTSLTFSVLSDSNIVAGEGLVRSGDIIDIVSASSSRIVVNPDSIDLALTGVVAGTYTKITVDSYGRATFGDLATTSDISEGSNLYFTNERVDDRVSNLLVAGSGITIVYNDPGNEITISSSGSAAFEYNETPSGSIDGVNDTFNLAFIPAPSKSLMLFKNGLLQQQGAGNDYTLLSSTITFETGNLPQIGDILLATYQK